jgi:hypothetical protein
LKLEKSEKEVVYMKTDKAYERTYGWSWFLKLHQELKGLGELDKVINMMLISFFKCIKVSFLGNLPLRFISNDLSLSWNSNSTPK